MLIYIPHHVQCYILTPGRCIHAFERVATTATVQGLDEIAAKARAGIAESSRVLDMQEQRRIMLPGFYGPDTVEIDHQVDRGLTSVDSNLGGQIDLFPADHPRAIAASAIRLALFPQGVLAITRQPFVQQRVDVARLLDAYDAPELAPARAELPELEPMMKRLAELNQKYGESIDAYDRNRPSLDDLRAAQERAHTLLTETIVLILAEYIRCAPERREQVGELLEPIVRQNEAVRAARRRRRLPVDLEPGTGDELPEDDVPAEQPA
jgi:hypothetical protein